MILKRCPLCRSTRIRRAKEDYGTTRAGRRVVVPDIEVTRCANCGQGFLSNEAARQLEAGARRSRKRAA
jgi:YgiT-type zinc finger domain-containing protein